MSEKPQPLSITEDEYEIARKAVEDALIWRRDNRVFTVRNNGLCIKERSGEGSALIRMGMEDALRVALDAINESRSKTEVQHA